jgi:hypothetical protein
MFYLLLLKQNELLGEKPLVSYTTVFQEKTFSLKCCLVPLRSQDNVVDDCMPNFALIELFTMTHLFAEISDKTVSN